MEGIGESFGKNGKFEKSRNAFGTAYRSDERLLLCDGAALRLPFGLPFGREHFVVLEHFVVALLADRARAENLGRAVPGKSFKYRNKSFIIVFCRPDGANG